jgi:hypothetical protein
MQEKIKGVFNRESGIKKTFDEGNRKIRTNVIVTGVATSPDSQVRSRYCHVQVSERNRKGNHYDWFEQNCDRFFMLGRFIMRRRKEFAKLAMEQMHLWFGKNGAGIKDSRAKIVHGASFASFAAIAGMLGSHGLEELENFGRYLLDHCSEAVATVREQVNVNQFWTDLLSANASNAFGETAADRRKVFMVRYVPKKLPASITPYQLQAGKESPYTEWKSPLLFFRPDPVIDMLRRYKRLLGKDLPLDRTDLRAQMKTRSYFVPPKAGADVHKQRFHGSKSPQTCWCISIDEFEGLGYQPVSDQVFTESLYKDGKVEGELFLEKSEWQDPRKGDLFALIESLEGRHEEGAQ